MRGWVAISVTATPAAAPRRIREVLRIIIREPPGLRLRPTMGLDRRVSRPCTGWFAPPALATADWAPPPITATGSPVTTNCPKSTDIRSIPANMIFVAGIKDQELTIIDGHATDHCAHCWRIWVGRRRVDPSNKLSRASTYPRAGSLRLSAGTSGYRSLRLAVEDTSMTSPTWRALGTGRLSLFRNQRLCSDSAGRAAWSRNLC